MTRIECFWLETTSQVKRSLRRFSTLEKGSCPGPMGSHDGWLYLDTIDNPEDAEGITHLAEATVPHEDPRWPAKCDSCDYLFQEEDRRQTFQRRIYRRHDTGELMTLSEAPVGAMWDAHWYPLRGPDGICLVVKTPGGEWYVDAPSTSGNPWTRTGAVPKVTASPSILINNRTTPNYHGFLTDGFLVEC